VGRTATDPAACELAAPPAISPLQRQLLVLAPDRHLVVLLVVAGRLRVNRCAAIQPRRSQGLARAGPGAIGDCNYLQLQHLVRLVALHGVEAA
jgi:hypothetical protein